MAGLLGRVGTGSRQREVARGLYVAAIQQARKPAFYQEIGVPDTLDGRFDMIALHVFLLMYRLRNAGGDSKALSQALFDVMFADMDESLRELGVGDLSVGRRVKVMAKAFYGRVSAYQAALESADDAVLADALRRNVFRGGEVPSAALDGLVAYVRRQAGRLASIDPLRRAPGTPIFTEIEPEIGEREIG
jgi:cytochrome b pre-mRNA-processing protein 3